MSDHEDPLFLFFSFFFCLEKHNMVETDLGGKTTPDGLGKVDIVSTNANFNDPSVLVPQLESGGVTYGELAIAVKVLNAVADLAPSKGKRKMEGGSGLESYKHSNLRPLRKGLSKCLEIHQRSMYEGKTKDEYTKDKMEEKTLKRRKMAEREQQKKFLANTELRKGRMERLSLKQQEAEDEEVAKLQQMMMIPDGHVDTSCEPKLISNGEEESEPIQLPRLRSCYVCKLKFRQLHHFYDRLCPACATLNWEKRHQTADLNNKVAVVTGSRVKIGYQTCLKLLRAGATVVATTRFPNAAAMTYRQESDFNAWKDRLHVYGLDLRDVTGIEAFCRFLKMTYCDRGIDILINNACQTVRRPTAYYLPVCQKEQDIWSQADDTHKALLGGCVEFERVRRRILLEHKSGNRNALNRLEAGGGNVQLSEPNESSSKGVSSTSLVVATVDDDSSSNPVSVPFERTGVSHSTAMSQMILLPEDAGIDDSILPRGVTDINGQQLDLRKTNSWLLKMEEVSTPEVMECMFINAIAPFVLNSRLKPLMRIPNDHDDRYIINVSAMEGKFYRYKMANHPHTNMAKAALNMMTRTSAEDLAKNHKIYMNSVDTGWINDENPLERATKTAKVNNFQTPIDEIDAASRILDPIFTGINNPGLAKDFGKFLKDYKETEW